MENPNLGYLYKGARVNDCDNSIKSFTIEPEMEDFSDSSQLKVLIQELGIEDLLSSDTDPLKHDSLSPSTCVHCKLLKKISGLQSDITRMNQEICATNEILYLKKEQNDDLKNMINRLEENLSLSSDLQASDKNGTSCSCMNKCDLF